MLSVIGFLGAIALAVALCAYPLVRRLTGRLERLVPEHGRRDGLVVVQVDVSPDVVIQVDVSPEDF